MRAESDDEQVITTGNDEAQGHASKKNGPPYSDILKGEAHLARQHLRALNNAFKDLDGELPSEVTTAIVNLAGYLGQVMRDEPMKASR